MLSGERPREEAIRVRGQPHLAAGAVGLGLHPSSSSLADFLPRLKGEQPGVVTVYHLTNRGPARR